MAVTIVLVLVLLAIINFALEKVEIEVFSLLVMVSLVVFRILTPQEAFRGFANSAVVMIAGVMLLTGGILHNGAANMISEKIRDLAGTSEKRMAALLLGFVNVISSVINNVAATAMFIPVAEGLAKRFRSNRGNYLIPLAFASMTGGMCTLIGTSTNVAVSGALEGFGLAPLGMFELTPLGVVVAVVGLVYLVWAAPPLLNLPPEEEGAADAYGIRAFLYEVLVREGATLVGKTIEEARVRQLLGVNVLAVVRGDRRILSPEISEVVEAGDLLLVEGHTGTIPVVTRTKGLEIRSISTERREALESDRVKFVEATVSYNSPFIGKTLKEIDFQKRYGVRVLAIHRREEVVVEKVGRIPLRAGDVLLIHGPKVMFERMGREPTSLLIEDVVLPRYNPAKAVQGAAVFALVIVASALRWVDTPTAFLGGACIVMMAKVLPAGEAIRYLNLRFLVMLAAMVALGAAMERSGAAQLVAEQVFRLVGTDSPRVLVAAFWVLTVALTQPLGNAAAALLVLPISVRAAHDAGLDPRSLAISVTVAASCSFLTPFEPACLLVYGTGRYRIRHFLKVGSILTLLVFVVSIVLIPILWPLRPIP